MNETRRGGTSVVGGCGESDRVLSDRLMSVTEESGARSVVEEMGARWGKVREEGNVGVGMRIACGVACSEYI